MTGSDWSRVREVYAAVRGTTGEERDRRLAEYCGEDRALLEEVASLLDCDDRAGDFLTAPSGAIPPEELGAAAPWEGPPDLPGFRITGLLGRGGMGLVYEAEQEHPQRTVALKMMRSGLGTEMARRRFEYESDVLARLEHPAIARVYESGVHGVVTSHGSVEVPYFVMEYVRDAADVVAYAKRSELGRRARIALLLEVCEAVQHGHQRGVIHRDLKPANVLVGSDGRPKVIDFGIARVLGSNETQAPRTEAGEMLGTLPYMSPEQLGADPGVVDARADVHALGLILYELLCGRRAFDLNGQPFLEAAATVRDDPPVRPSAIDRSLAGDLEWILLRALEKDPERRYATVSELAADLRRHLLHEPVVAGPPSARYRLAKFVRRHRLGMAAGTAVLLALLAGVAATGVALLEARAQQRLAERRARMKGAAFDFVADAFSSVSPFREGSEVRIVDVLERAAGGIDLVAESAPEVRATLRDAFGRTYAALGRYDEAEAQLDRAVELYRELGPESEEELLASEAHYADLDASRDRLPEAAARLDVVLAEQRERLGAEHPDVLTSLTFRARVARLTGDFEAAERMLNEVVRVRSEQAGPDSPEAIRARRARVHVWFEQRRYDEALAEVGEIRRAEVEHYGEHHPAALGGAHALALLLYAFQRHDQTIALLEEICAAYEATTGSDHPDALAARVTLGQTYELVGDFDRAEAVGNDVVERARRVLGPTHRITVAGLLILSKVLSNRGDHRGAEPIVREIFEARLAASGPSDSKTLHAQNDLAVLLARLGRLDEAIEHARECLELCDEAFGSEYSLTLIAVSNLGTFLARAGRHEEARDTLSRALEYCLHAYGELNESTLYACFNLAQAMRKAGDSEGVEPLLLEVLDKAPQILPAGHWKTAGFRAAYGQFLMSEGRYEEAEAPLLEAHAASLQALGPEHSMTAQQRAWIVQVYEGLGREEDARRWREGED